MGVKREEIHITRNNNIDILKSICAFLIVCIHVPFPGFVGNYITALSRCILRSLADSDAFQSGRCAEHNGRPETLAIIN